MAKCVICGKDYKMKCGTQLTCSKECAKIREYKVRKEWQSNNQEKIKEYQSMRKYKRKLSKNKPTRTLDSEIRLMMSYNKSHNTNYDYGKWQTAIYTGKVDFKWLNVQTV